MPKFTLVGHEHVIECIQWVPEKYAPQILALDQAKDGKSNSGPDSEKNFSGELCRKFFGSKTLPEEISRKLYDFFQNNGTFLFINYQFLSKKNGLLCANLFFFFKFSVGGCLENPILFPWSAISGGFNPISPPPSGAGFDFSLTKSK